MSSAPPTAAQAYAECTCKQKVPLSGKRIGDSTRCPACQTLIVITRSNAHGELPAARRAAGLTSVERKEVNETLARIKLRRVGRASRHVELVPSWAILLAAGQFYLSGIFAGQNLIAVGEEKRGRRMQTWAALLYVLLGAAFLGIAFTIGARIPSPIAILALAGTPIVFGAYYGWAQHRACIPAREAGAQNAPVLLPLLVALILAIAQAFAVWILHHRLSGP